MVEWNGRIKLRTKSPIKKYNFIENGNAKKSSTSYHSEIIIIIIMIIKHLTVYKTHDLSSLNLSLSLSMSFQLAHTVSI